MNITDAYGNRWDKSEWLALGQSETAWETIVKYAEREQRLRELALEFLDAVEERFQQNALPPNQRKDGSRWMRASEVLRAALAEGGV